MEISASHVERSLETIRARLHRILDDGSPTVIAKAKAMLRESKRQYDESTRQGRQERRVRPWGFQIHPSNPLRFKVTESDGFRVRVDLSTKAFWASDPAAHPVHLVVVLRVWCLEPNLYFRDQWDAPQLRGQINSDIGRVMLRIHFDLANQNQVGPKYHCQVGGRQVCEELHWFPEALSVPRMAHMPMDLMLASELVAATFYPNEYTDIRREDSWKGSRRVSQEHLLCGYFEEALRAVSNNKSVLEALWNVPFR